MIAEADVTDTSAFKDCTSTCETTKAFMVLMYLVYLGAEVLGVSECKLHNPVFRKRKELQELE